MDKENLEEYLELFYKLSASGKPIKTTEVAKELRTTSGNVSQALKKLKSKGLIKYEPYKEIELTDKGKIIGKEISEKHEIAEQFLEEVLNLDPKQAHEEACRIEHAISRETAEKLSGLLEKPRNVKSLVELMPGENGTVTYTRGGRMMMNKLISLHILPGTEISIERGMPFKGPMVIRVGQTRICIGRGMARHIFVEVK